MRRTSSCLAAIAMAATAQVGAAQTADYAPGSRNTVVRDVPIMFSEEDYGRIVELMFDECTSGDNTVMFNGPYRRVANVVRADGNGNNKTLTGTPVNSAGDARLDYVVLRVNNLPSVNQTKTVEVTAGDVEDQLGIKVAGNSSNTVVLSAEVSRADNGNGLPTYTVRDTSPPTQILDAGRDITATPPVEVGGVDAMMIIKNGQPKTADMICDMNAWWLTSDPPTTANDFEYGFKDFVISNNNANYMYLFWAAGPSGLESAANIATVDDLFNPSTTPTRDDEGVYLDPDESDSCPAPGQTLSPALSCVGADWTREERTDVALGKYQSFFGDTSKPINVTAFGGNFASYCDPTEPTPDPLGTDPVTGSENAGPSGNACNRNRGLSGGPSVTITSTLEENAGLWMQTDEGWIYIQF